MKTLAPLALLLLTALAPLATASPADDPPTMEQAERLIERERWGQAIEAFGAIVAAEPDNGTAWFYLAYAQSSSGDHAAAVPSNRRAAEFPRVRRVALYNLACALSNLERLDEAAAALGDAIDAGYLDFDAIERDPDLFNLRSAGLLPELPPELEYADFEAANRVTIPHYVQLPAGFDAEREVEALLVFGPGSGGRRNVDWVRSELFRGAAAQRDWVVVFVVPPAEKGWWTHPTHHALEDLLDEVRELGRVAEDGFHFFGFMEGAAPATTYSHMSRKYCKSLTCVSGSGFGNYDDRELRRYGDRPVNLIVGAGDSHLHGVAVRDRGRLDANDVRGELLVRGGEAAHVSGLRGEALFAQLREILAAKLEDDAVR